MKKKHYIMLADALRATRPSTEDWNDIARAHRDQWEKDVSSICAALTLDNPRTFDRALFLTNVGVKHS